MTLPSALRLPPSLKRDGKVGESLSPLLLRGETGDSRSGVKFSYSLLGNTEAPPDYPPSKLVELILKNFP